MMRNPPLPSWLDLAAAVLVTLFAAAAVIVPPPNLDLWWLLAVGRRIVETHAYIYRDPFTFTVTGTPWSPQSYLSAIVFYVLHVLGGVRAIGVLRVGLVAAVVLLTLRAARRAGVGAALTAPLVLLMVLVSQGRFTDRGQLFEYAFLAWLLGFLLTCHERDGVKFFLPPLLVQLIWVQAHSSFLLGPVVAALFFAGEWVSARVPVLRPLHRRPARRGLLLVLLMAAACVVNPNPHAFLIQPFGSAQRELLSRFTLEWKSPFDPAMAAANFHPYYEILLAAAGLAILANLRRLPLAPVLLLAATAYLSLQSHRFRVEFALVAVPMIASLAHAAPASKWLATRARLPKVAWGVAALALAVALGAIERGRIREHPVVDLDPTAALAFIADNDIAHRPYHPIGFGSYMLWDLYGRRRTFIDGRNFDPGLYRDFLVAQTRPAGTREVIAKYRLDSFLLPAPARADAGMMNIHRTLMAAGKTWALVHMDPIAFVYVASASVDSTWLAAHAYRAYNPLTFSRTPHRADELAPATGEIERATRESPDFSSAWLDLGVARFTGRDYGGAATAFRRAADIDPDNVVAWSHLGRAELAAGHPRAAVAACEEIVRRVPNSVAGWLDLARAWAEAGERERALEACGRAVALAPTNREAVELQRRLSAAPSRGPGAEKN